MKVVVFKIRKQGDLKKITEGKVADEMHRVAKSFALIANRLDDNDSALPASMFKVTLYSYDHQPAHFHIFSRQLKWNAKYLIEGGEFIFSDARMGVHMDEQNVHGRVKRWLFQLSVLPQAHKGETNQQLLMRMWTSYNK